MGYCREEDLSPIVVVVDDDLAAGIVESFLKSAGYPVVRAEHAAQVLILASRHQARVVVLDLNNSHRTGLEVIRFLRKGEGRGLRVLALTVQTRAGLADEARAAGADSFLTRPFRPGDLIESVARLYTAEGEAPVEHPRAGIALLARHASGPEPPAIAA